MPTSTPAVDGRERRTGLEIDPACWSEPAVYRLITSLVVPRPIAWVSTVDLHGGGNVAPYSYFTVVADHPPHVVFSSIGEKETLRNIRATGEFVVNVADQRLLARLLRSAGRAPADSDGFRTAGVTPVPSRRIRPARVAEARAHLECELVQVHPVGNGNLVVGRVVHVQVDAAVWRDGRADSRLLDPVLRLARSYGRLGPDVTADAAQPS